MPDDDDQKKAEEAAKEAEKQREEALKSLKPEKNPAENVSADDIAKADEEKSSGIGGLFGRVKAPKPEEVVGVPEVSPADIPGPKGLF